MPTELSTKVGEGNFPRSRVDISCKLLFFFLFVQILRLVLVLLRELIFLMFSALHLFKVSQDGVLDRAAFKRYSWSPQHFAKLKTWVSAWFMAFLGAHAGRLPARWCHQLGCKKPVEGGWEFGSLGNWNTGKLGGECALPTGGQSSLIAGSTELIKIHVAYPLEYNKRN